MVDGNGTRRLGAVISLPICILAVLAWLFYPGGKDDVVAAIAVPDAVRSQAADPVDVVARGNLATASRALADTVETTPGRTVSAAMPDIHRLEAAADNGDVEAATALARYANGCAHAAKLREILPSLLSQDVATMTETAKQKYLRDLDAIKQRIDSYQNPCSETGDYLIAHRTEALLIAANLGNKNSARCFITLALDLSDLRHDPELMRRYRRSAASLIETSLKKGDWEVVRTMIYAYGEKTYANKLPDSMLIVEDPVIAYGYAKFAASWQPQRRGNRRWRSGRSRDDGSQSSLVFQRA